MDDLPIFVGKYSGIPLGQDPETNIFLAVTELSLQPKKVNEKSNPAVGEAYAIIDLNPDTSTPDVSVTPYHVALVIDKSRGRNITIEADSGDENLTRPVFDIYSSPYLKPIGNTFHRRYMNNFNTPVTIAVRPLERE